MKTTISFSIIAVFVVLAFTACPEPSPPPPSNDTRYDPTGTWEVSIQGQSATITITENYWTFFNSIRTMYDSGTFTISENVATLYSNSEKTIIGTSSFTSNTTATLKLQSPSTITGDFTVTRAAYTPTEGTFRIRITGIPATVMASGSPGSTTGYIAIALYTPNTLAASSISLTDTLILYSERLGGRSPNVWTLSDDTNYTGQNSGSFYYEFNIWEDISIYVGPPGNYDIGFFKLENDPGISLPNIPSDVEVRAISNRPFQINTVTTFELSDFVTKAITQ